MMGDNYISSMSGLPVCGGICHVKNVISCPPSYCEQYYAFDYLLPRGFSCIFVILVLEELNKLKCIE